VHGSGGSSGGPRGFFGSPRGVLGCFRGVFWGPSRARFSTHEKWALDGSPRGRGRAHRGGVGACFGNPWGSLRGPGGFSGGLLGSVHGPFFDPRKTGPGTGAPEAAGGPVGVVGAAVGVLGRFLGCFGSFRTLFGADLWSRSDKNHFRPTLCFAQTHLS
jgi:hypothetical protein